MDPKTITLSIKAAPAGADFDAEFVCSTDATDRADEIIHQDGWQLDNFRKNPVFLAAHQHRLADGRSPVIGSFTDSTGKVTIGLEKDGLVGKVRFADTELGREYKSLYKDGHMRAVSVGFQPLKGEYRDTGKAGAKQYHHTSQELYEVSAVAVGCNQEALARLRALGLEETGRDRGDQEDLKAIKTSLLSLQKSIETQSAEIAEIKCLLLDDAPGQDSPATSRAGEGGREGKAAGKGLRGSNRSGLAEAVRAMLDA
ncbi:MAG: HK97 family phage prohead protease [Phycisphaerae bacterium]